MDVCQASGLTYWTAPILTVRTSVRSEQVGTHWTKKLDICDFLFNLSRKIQVPLKSDDNDDDDNNNNNNNNYYYYYYKREQHTRKSRS
jgi:hypothetical protein